MLNDDEFNRIVQAFPILQIDDAAMLRTFKGEAFMASIPKGHDIFLEGDGVEAIALMIAGQVRVYKISETGREITLYRFGNGESCVLTANAIMNEEGFAAIATVERDAQAVMIPADTFREWVKRYDVWRSFAFQLVSQRLLTVMEVVDQVAFQRLDKRLSAVLLRMETATIRTTHQDLANELGSSREVISRLLEEFAAQGIIETGRGKIEIVDRDALTDLAVM